MSRIDDLFDTDDFYTYGGEKFTSTWVGCGGEFCPGPYGPDNPQGPGDPSECGKCRRRERHSATGWRAAY